MTSSQRGARLVEPRVFHLANTFFNVAADPHLRVQCEPGFQGSEPGSGIFFSSRCSLALSVRTDDVEGGKAMQGLVWFVSTLRF